jgi:hypothetical protein
MENRRWINQSQPQTLQIAVFLLYAGAAFALLRGDILFALAGGAAGFGIANEQKWGYGVGIAVTVLPFVLLLTFGSEMGRVIRLNVIGLMFDIALLALLLHPQSRDYQRIWFK